MHAPPRRRGIARERAAFAGKPFVVVSYRRELDHDGLTEHVSLVERFADADEARELVDAVVQREQRQALEVSGPSWAVV